jgi:hypothetical protein
MRPSGFIGVVSHVPGACIGSSAGSVLRAHAKATRTDALAMTQCVLRGKNRVIFKRPNALVQLQARYNHRGEAASEKCLSAATFVRSHARMA